MRKFKKLTCCILLCLAAVLFLGTPVEAATAENLYNSPYVDFTADGIAWTTCEGDLHNYEYYEGKTVTTGIASALRSLQVGEHYYDYERTGTIPVGKWVVEWGNSNCIHDAYPPENDDFHDIPYRRNPCGAYYTQGWIAYCADCNQEVKYGFVYMCEEAAKSIDYIDTGTEYYYMCPHCDNLEQGYEIDYHMCQLISWNQYRVGYDANTAEMSYAMQDSIHMYNNATSYDGDPVTPVKTLSKNIYKRSGYEFIGWNTEPDGSGTWYADEEEIYNLTTYDYKRDNLNGRVVLYAQWKQSESTLEIDPEEGEYLGTNDITSITRYYFDSYEILEDDITPPDGATVTFVTNGGTAVSPVTGTTHFDEWIQSSPFLGKLVNGNIYRYAAPDGNVDRLTASYAPDAITLPGTTRANYSFGGWYYDAEFKRPAGGVGDTIIPNEDLTLYAQWVNLTLYSKDNYVDNDLKGAVDLWWEQPDDKNKAYKLYQSLDSEDWYQIDSAYDKEELPNVTEEFSFTGYNKTYTVPYTGLYTITAAGAQGGDYEDVSTGDIHNGGLGGSVTGEFWLNKGDVITYSVGGQNGFKDGGAAVEQETTGGNILEAYGNGGGATRITSKEYGLLLVAGGGGGATIMGDGHEGGSSRSLRADGAPEGASGQAGGGGGYVGGNAGEAVFHYHVPLEEGETQNECFMETGGDLLDDFTVTSSRYESSWEFNKDGRLNTAYVETKALGSSDVLIPASEGATLKLEGDVYYYFVVGNENINKTSTAMMVYDQDGNLIYTKTAADLETWVSAQKAKATWDTSRTRTEVHASPRTYDCINYHDEDEESDTYGEYTDTALYYLHWDGENVYKSSYLLTPDSEPDANSYLSRSNAAEYWYPEIRTSGSYWYGTYKYIFREELEIPEGVTGIYIKFQGLTTTLWQDPYVSLTVAEMTGQTKVICGYEDGELVSSKPAYGGSSYVNTDLCSNYTFDPGVQEGDGEITIQSKDLSFFDDTKADGVPAPDLVAPDKVQTDGINRETGENAVSFEAVSDADNRVKIIWTQPKDNGTPYYHMVESHLAVTGAKLCTSNTVLNTLTTGVKGYYYIINTAEHTTVTRTNSTFTTERSAEVTLTNVVQYLHIAPIDVAGNLGETSTIYIGSTDVPVKWPLYTQQIHLFTPDGRPPQGAEPADGIYPAAADKTYYIRCDGETPFEMRFSAYMLGAASSGYQINQTIFESQMTGQESARNITVTPLHSIQSGSIVTSASGLRHYVQGNPVLQSYSYIQTTRSNSNKVISTVKQFLLGTEADSKTIRVTPVAAVETDTISISSDMSDDLTHSIYLIGDCTAPAIGGMDELRALDLVNKAIDSNVTINLTATDTGSGVSEFYAVLTNHDNHITETIYSEDGATLSFDIIVNKAVLNGDVTVEVHAIDNVGNERVDSHDFTEFTLTVSVKRMLAPHDPIFKGGETGILSITTTGYVDSLEIDFPEILDDYDCTIDYPKPYYRKDEELEFMIPLYAAESENYTIMVTAYKGSSGLEERPKLAVLEVEGSILDELRTRLR